MLPGLHAKKFSYAQRRTVASGGADPEAGEQRTGSRQAIDGELADIRNPQGLAGGQAASALSHVAQPLSSDKPHLWQVDGHGGWAGATHPNGLFALAPAATSSHSADANLEHFMGLKGSLLSLLGTGGTGTTGGGSTQAENDAQARLNALLEGWRQADTLPRDQVFPADRDSLVRTAAGHVRTPTGNLWTGEWTFPQVAGVGIGALLVGSVLA